MALDIRSNVNMLIVRSARWAWLMNEGTQFERNFFCRRREVRSSFVIVLGALTEIGSAYSSISAIFEGYPIVRAQNFLGVSYY